MADVVRPGDGRAMRRLRGAGWSAAAAALMLPAAAMRFTDEVRWTGSDFALGAVMLLLAGGAMELFARVRRGWAYRCGAALAVAAAFLLAWVDAAVGIVGRETDHANLMYAGVLAIVVVGAAAVRLRPVGMTAVMVAAEAAQVTAGVVALATGLGADGPIWPRDVIGATGLFAVLWLGAAGLFALAARQEPRP